MADYDDFDNSTHESLLLYHPSISLEETESASRVLEETMTSAMGAERPSSSLSESWATLSASDAQSEDEARSEQTDLASLVSPSAPDDVTSLNDGHDTSDFDSEDGQSNCSEEQDMLPSSYHGYGTVESSNLSTSTAFQAASESIEFQEPETWGDSQTALVNHTIRISEDDMLPDSLSNQGFETRIVVKLEQAISKQSLDPDKPFRILYVGSNAIKQRILDKMGDALIAGSKGKLNSEAKETSRYHVVPTSFDMGTSPVYAELLPMYLQLVVDQCSVVSMTKGPDGKDKIKMDFNNRDPCLSTWTNDQYEIMTSSPWAVPDIAIFALGDNDTPKTQEQQRLAHTFLERHGVPYTVISESPIWDKTKKIIPLDPQSTQVYVECYNIHATDLKLVQNYPVDLQTFESIDAGQMNRNFAALSSKPNNIQPVIVQKLPKDYPIFRKVVEYFNPNTYNWIAIIQTLLFALISFLTLLLGYGIFKATFFLISYVYSWYIPILSSILLRNPSLSASETAIMHTASAKSTATSLMPTSASDVILSNCENKDLPAFEDSLLLLSHSSSGISNPSEKFQVHTIGDCHILIKSSPDTLRRRKPVKFDVKVTRNSEELPYSISKLFDEVYVLRLAPEHAYGTLKVSITTQTKPKSEHVTQVDFGKPWLKIARWKRAAQAISSELVEEFSAAQSSLSDVYNRVSADLQVVSDTLKDEAKSTHRGWLQRVGETANPVALKPLQRSIQSAKPVVYDSLQRAVKSTKTILARSKLISGAVTHKLAKPMALNWKPILADIKTNTGKHLISSSKMLRQRSHAVNNGFMRLANKMSSVAQQKRAHMSTEGFNRFFSCFPQMVISQPLGKAQQQARKIVCNSIRGSLTYAEEHCSNGKRR